MKKALAHVREFFNVQSEVTSLEPTPEEIRQRLLEQVEKAHKEWLEAKNYFQFVSNPDLVDHAIYAIEAAEKKYMYLLKLAREEGISGTITWLIEED